MLRLECSGHSGNCCTQPGCPLLQERLNGYYGVSQFTVSNTLASLPFIFLISVVSGKHVVIIQLLACFTAESSSRGAGAGAQPLIGG